MVLKLWWLYFRLVWLYATLVWLLFRLMWWCFRLVWLYNYPTGVVVFQITSNTFLMIPQTGRMLKVKTLCLSLCLVLSVMYVMALKRALFQGVLEGRWCQVWHRKRWMDIPKWTSLPMPELLTMACCRKDWKRIFAESSVMSTQPSQSRGWPELNWWCHGIDDVA